MPERLYIVDGHGYIFRAHYGLMNISRGERREVRLSTAEGMPTGALYVFTRMLMRLEEDNQPDRIAVVFDDKSGVKTFRAEMYPAYKATRKEPPEELQVQMDYFAKIVTGMGWPVVTVAGVEADDVIATMVRDATERGWEVVIYSADKDIMSLVGPHVSMIDALHGKTYTRDEVIKKMGVPPEKIPDFLALVGDTSDNIPGLKGVGDKTAAALLDQYGSLDALIAANPVVPRIAVKQPFGDDEQLARVRMSRKLVELERHVPLPRPIDGLHATQWDLPVLLQLFTELEFQVLVEKVKMRMPPDEGLAIVAAPETTAVAAVEAPSETRLVPASGLAKLARACRDAGRVAVTVELDPERFDRAHLVAIVLAVPGEQPAYVPLAHRYIGAPAPPPAADLPPIYDMLADPAVAKICHDSKTIARVLLDLGIELAGVVEDTMLAAFLLDATQDAEPGEAVVQRLGGVTLPARSTLAGRGGRTSLEGVDVERALAVGRRDHGRAAADRRPAAGAPRRWQARAPVPRRRAADRAPARAPRARRHPHRRRAPRRAVQGRRRPARRARAARLRGRRRRAQHRLAQAARRAAVRQARPRHQGRAPHEDRVVDRRRHARGHGRAAPGDRADPRAPRALQAQGHVPRRAAAARVAAHRPRPHDLQPGRRPRPGASRRRTRTSRTSRSAPSSAATSGARSSPRRATC